MSDRSPELVRIAEEFADFLATECEKDRMFIKAEFHNLVKSALIQRDEDARAMILKIKDDWNGSERWVG